MKICDWETGNENLGMGIKEKESRKWNVRLGNWDIGNGNLGMGLGNGNLEPRILEVKSLE